MPVDVQDKAADAHAAADDRTEKYTELMIARVEELLDDVEERDLVVWETQGADAATTSDVLLNVPIAKRTATWQEAYQTMYSAAYFQAYVEIICRDILSASKKHAGKIEAARKTLTPEQIRAAAVEGVSKAQHEAAKERRKTGTE